MRHENAASQTKGHTSPHGLPSCIKPPSTMVHMGSHGYTARAPTWRLQLCDVVAGAFREDHWPEGRRHEVRGAAGHRGALVDIAAGGQGSTLCEALL